MNSARTLRLGFLLAALSAICLAQGPAQHKIGVRTVNGVGQFYLRDTGAPFVPRGNNFIRLAQQTRLPAYGATPQLTHSLFNVGLYSASDAEQALARMQSDGYNTVRVFLNGEIRCRELLGVVLGYRRIPPTAGHLP